jgi:hypothetical protein
MQTCSDQDADNAHVARQAADDAQQQADNYRAQNIAHNDDIVHQHDRNDQALQDAANDALARADQARADRLAAEQQAADAAAGIQPAQKKLMKQNKQQPICLMLYRKQKTTRYVLTQ